MGIFEKVMQERHPAAESIALSTREAFAAIVIGAFNADGRVAREEAVRVNEIFNSTRLFQQPAAPSVNVVLDRVAELFRVHGQEIVVERAANALPAELRSPAFAIAVDLVLADGEASAEERQFIDALQGLLKVGDEDAIKIVDVMIVKNSV